MIFMTQSKANRFPFSQQRKCLRNDRLSSMAWLFLWFEERFRCNREGGGGCCSKYLETHLEKIKYKQIKYKSPSHLSKCRKYSKHHSKILRIFGVLAIWCQEGDLYGLLKRSENFLKFFNFKDIWDFLPVVRDYYP